MTTSYDERVNIDPVWSPAGLAATRGLGLSPAEVVSVVYAPTSISLVGPRTIWFVGQLIDGRAILTVVTDRQARNTTIFEIVSVRYANDEEINLWRSKQK